MLFIWFIKYQTLTLVIGYELMIVTQCSTPHRLSKSSYPTRILGITVKYFSVKHYIAKIE